MNKNDNYNFDDDFLLKKAALSLAEKDTKLFDKLEKDNTIINPKQDELDKKIYSLINEHFINDKAKLLKQKNLKKFIFKVAALIIIITSGFIVPFVTVDAFREKVLNFYIENFNTHDSFAPIEENKSLLTFKVGYMPQGYNVGDEYKSENFYSLTYYNFQNKMIDIALYDQNASFSIDTENCEKYNIIINYVNGYIYRKPGTVTMIFKFHGNSIVISGNDDALSNEELISIGKSIK
nr:DUF4367 domain-containing protein [Sedimentibacter sp.]